MDLRDLPSEDAVHPFGSLATRRMDYYLDCFCFEVNSCSACGLVYVEVAKCGRLLLSGGPTDRCRWRGTLD